MTSSYVIDRVYETEFRYCKRVVYSTRSHEVAAILCRDGVRLDSTYLKLLCIEFASQQIYLLILLIEFVVLYRNLSIYLGILLINLYIDILFCCTVLPFSLRIKYRVTGRDSDQTGVIVYLKPLYLISHINIPNLRPYQVSFSFLNLVILLKKKQGDYKCLKLFNYLIINKLLDLYTLKEEVILSRLPQR